MAGYVSPATAAVGVLPASLLNSYKTALDVIANPAQATMYQTTTVTAIANSTTVWTPIGFDAEVTDTVNGHSTVTNNARYTVQTGWGGLYVIQGSVDFAGNATGIRWVGVAVNGTAPTNGTIDGTAGVANASPLIIGAYAEIVLAAGDYVQLVAIQSSGGALNTAISLPFTSSMTVRWVGAT